MQPGDVVATAADAQALHEWIGFKPSTLIEVGVQKFARWHQKFYEKIHSFEQKIFTSLTAWLK